MSKNADLTDLIHLSTLPTFDEDFLIQVKKEPVEVPPIQREEGPIERVERDTEVEEREDRVAELTKVVCDQDPGCRAAKRAVL